MSKKKLMKMINLESISIILSLLIAVVSLVISLVALKIAQKTYIFSSKDYTPDIKYTIEENDDIEIINNSNDLFRIDYINLVKIRTIGYEDYENKAMVEIPFVINSLQFRWIENEGKARKLFIKADTPGPCAYICAYDSKMLADIREKIDTIYNIDSEKGYALPSLQSQSYIIEIVYTDNFQERKSVAYIQEHIHGFGYDKTRISMKELGEILNKANIPKYSSVDELWNYVKTKYSIPVDNYF